MTPFTIDKLPKRFHSLYVSRSEVTVTDFQLRLRLKSETHYSPTSHECYLFESKIIETGHFRSRRQKFIYYLPLLSCNFR